MFHRLIFFMFSSGLFLLSHSPFANSQSTDSLAAMRHQSSAFVRVLREVELNGMSLNGFSIDLGMNVEVATRFFSDIFRRASAAQYVHNDLPLRMMHWGDADQSSLLVFAQVGENRTKGFLSTLALNRANLVDHSMRDNSTQLINEYSEKKETYRLLQQLNLKRLFTYHDQHVIAGFIDLALPFSASSKFLTMLQSQSWVPVSQFPSHLVMTKNGETVELTHHDGADHTLTLLYSK